MEYFVQLSPQQLSVLTEITEDNTLSQIFRSFIDETQIEEYVEIALAYLYRETYRKELKKRITTENSTYTQSIKDKQNREIAKKIAQNIRNNVEINVKYMTPHNKLETVMDALLQNIEWIDKSRMMHKTNQLSTEEIKEEKQRKEKSFGKRTFGKLELNAEQSSETQSESNTSLEDIFALNNSDELF